MGAIKGSMGPGFFATKPYAETPHKSEKKSLESTEDSSGFLPKAILEIFAAIAAYFSKGEQTQYVLSVSPPQEGEDFKNRLISFDLLTFKPEENTIFESFFSRKKFDDVKISASLLQSTSPNRDKDPEDLFGNIQIISSNGEPGDLNGSAALFADIPIEVS